jgi:serine/threonine protein kinase
VTVSFPSALEGRSVDAMLEDRRRRGQGGISEGEALALLRPAVDALAVAHGMAIAHRDIKPANLFLVGAPRSMFREEGQRSSALSSAHLSIVRVFDFDVTSSARGASVPFLVRSIGAPHSEHPREAAGAPTRMSLGASARG